MPHQVVDPPGLESRLARMDAVAKFCAAFLTILVIASFPADSGWRFGAVAGVLGAVWVVSSLPLRYLGGRLLATTPFIALAAVLPLAAGAPQAGSMALAVLWKAYSAVVLLSLLTGTTRVEEILAAMRRIGVPRGFALVAALTHRYLFVLAREWRRAARARDVRTGGRVASGRLRLWANQAATVFLRGWNRSERVAEAMLARGFRGEFPRPAGARWRARDLPAALALPLAVVALRLA